VIGEPLVVRDCDLAIAAEIVRISFGLQGLTLDQALQIVREEFSERWPDWGDRELVLALQAALVVH
jgi:hypothetical protein